MFMDVVTTFFKKRYRKYLLTKLSKLRSQASKYAQLAFFCKSEAAIECDYMENCLSSAKLHPYDTSYFSDYNHHLENHSLYMIQYNYYFSKYESCSSEIDKLEEKLNNL